MPCCTNHDLGNFRNDCAAASDNKYVEILMYHTDTDCQVSQRVPDSNRSELQSQRFPLKNQNRPDDRQNGPDDRFFVSFVANITYLSHVSIFAVFLALLAVDKQLKFFTSNHVFSTNYH